MTSTAPNSTLRHSQKTLDRATRAVRCAPFRMKLYVQMLEDSISLSSLVGIAGTRNQFAKRVLSELSADSEMLWLIQVGLLRREVDGQGLTDRFRLTPLGRQLVAQWRSVGGFGQANFRDRLFNLLTRWLRVPI